jgi:hypothetical protein
VRDTVAEVLHDLYDGFDFDPEGEDHGLMWSTEEAERSGRQGAYWKQINDAREAQGNVTWDGLLLQAVYEANAESDPNTKTDALLRVAATALSFAKSVQRQTDAFNADEEAEQSEEDGE